MAPSPYIFIISIGLAYMNKYARFDEIPSMTLKDIKETKHYGRTDGRTMRKQYIPPQTQFAGGVITLIKLAPSPYFSTICICSVDMNVYARLY